MKLSAGKAELVLAPQTGGSVVSWSIAGQPILRKANPNAADARGNACYPLVPFSNRVAGRRFSFAGQTYELPALLGEWAIHGAGWQCPWTPEAIAASSAILALDYPGGALWPFAFRATQRFELEPDRLIVTMRITNTDVTAAPAALGLHPFFHRSADTWLQTKAASVWQSGADKIPTSNTQVPPEWDFSIARPLDDAEIDHCFAGWSGQATLTWADRARRLRIEAGKPFGHLVLYVPKRQDHLAIEPVSNMNDGLNHMNATDDHGMVVLEPGQRLEGRISMIVEDAEIRDD